MSVRCLGFCSVDESVDLELLRLVGGRFPAAEFGVLFREDKEGTPRYPKAEWVNELAEVAAATMPPLRLAAHLCGRRCSDLLNGGDLTWVRERLLPLGFRRVQVNATKINGVDIKDPLAAAGHLHTAIREIPQLEWIIQVNEETRPLWEPLMAETKAPHNVSILYDASCGTGKPIESFQPPPRNGLRCGYAGGIGPDSIVSVLKALRGDVARGKVIWLDMESRLRSVVDGKDTFDVQKVLAVCKAVTAVGWEQPANQQGISDVPPPPPPPPNAKVSGHPLLAHKMTLLRDVRTAPRDFRHLLRELTFHVGYEATATLLTAPRSDVVTPCGIATGDKAVRIVESVALVPVLRAGLGMVDAMLELLPNATVHHLGMFRSHGGPNSKPIEYYSRLPKDRVSDIVFVLDPMIATSMTIHAAIAKLKSWGARKIVVIGVVASYHGLVELNKSHPEVPVYAVSVDHTLRDDGFIIPGLGDAGDRQFGTPAGTPLTQNIPKSAEEGRRIDIPGRGRFSPTPPGTPNPMRTPHSPEHRPVTRVLGDQAHYVDPSLIPDPELPNAAATPLTTHDGAFGSEPLMMMWGAKTPGVRGPVLATSRHPNQRNAIGAHAGGYSIYRALAVLSNNLDINYTPKLGMTTPVARIGPFPAWGDPKRIVTMDPWGHAISEGFASWIEKGYDIRPTIAITKAHIELPEVKEAVRVGRLKADGAVLLQDGQSFVTKAAIEPVWYLPGIAERFGVTEDELRQSIFTETNSMYPELLTRRDLKLFLPPVGGMTVYIWGDPEKIPDESVELTCRVHDECNGSDVFGSDICTCRPYLTHAIEECIKTAQRGGTGVVVYFRKEGRALGEVTKYLVYNMRKRQEGGDKASEYFNCTKEVAGVTDTRFQVMMPDVLHWLGVSKIHRFISMSDMKHDAIVASGIRIEERVEIPPEMVPKDAQVEIAAKVFAGYHAGKAYEKAQDASTLEQVKGREYTAATDYTKSVTEGGGSSGTAQGQ